MNKYIYIHIYIYVYTPLSDGRVRFNDQGTTATSAKTSSITMAAFQWLIQSCRWWNGRKNILDPECGSRGRFSVGRRRCSFRNSFFNFSIITRCTNIFKTKRKTIQREQFKLALTAWLKRCDVYDPWFRPRNFQLSTS